MQRGKGSSARTWSLRDEGGVGRGLASRTGSGRARGIGRGGWCRRRYTERATVRRMEARQQRASVARPGTYTFDQLSTGGSTIWQRNENKIWRSRRHGSGSFEVRVLVGVVRFALPHKRPRAHRPISSKAMSANRRKLSPANLADCVLPREVDWHREWIGREQRVRTKATEGRPTPRFRALGVEDG